MSGLLQPESFERRLVLTLRRLSSVVGFGLLFGTRIFAQESGEDREVYELSPFVVDASEDDRYWSSNSVSGTSLNTRIQDLPMSIEVINGQFIEDLGATNLEEALAYSSGIFQSDLSDEIRTLGANRYGSADVSPSSLGGVNGHYDKALVIRGFNVPFQNRDGFRYGGLVAQYGTILGGISDASNIDRLEVVRGPNSLLYGVGVLSGIVNVIPKRPLSAQSREFSVGVGSEGYWRTTIGATGPLSKDLWGGRLNYRFGATLENGDHWTDWRSKDLEYYVGQLEWYTDRVSFLVEGQFADQVEWGIGDQHIHDDVTGAYDKGYRNEYGEQVNWTKSLGGLSESFRITGPDTYHSRREGNLLANLDFTPIDDLTISVGAFLTGSDEETFDVNVSTIVNSGDDYFDEFDLAPLVQRGENTATEDWGKIQAWSDAVVTIRSNDHLKVLQKEWDPRDIRDFRTVRYWWEKRPESTDTEQYRIRLSYDFESRLWGDSMAKHRFLVGRHDIKDDVDVVVGDAEIDWQYAIGKELADSDPLHFRSIDDHSVFRYQGEQLSIPGREFRNVEMWFTGHYALYQGQLLDDKLGLVFGARRDRYQARDRLYDRFDDEAYYGDSYTGQNTAVAPDAWTGVVENPGNETFGFYPAIEGVSEYIPHPDRAEKTTTKMFAVDYELREGLSLYALSSEGLMPNTGVRDGNLEGFPSEKSTSEEVGVKFDLMEGKLSGSVSTYRIERENALWDFYFAPAPARWVGGVVHPTDELAAGEGYDPSLVLSGTLPASYGGSVYFYPEGVELGEVARDVFDDEGNLVGSVSEYPDGLLAVGYGVGGPPNPFNFAFYDYNKLDLPAIDKYGNEIGHTWRYFLEKAFADGGRAERAFTGEFGSENFYPVHYFRIPNQDYLMNPSDRLGAIVSYTDEAKGVDMQLVYSPSRRLQLVFNYAHTEREAITPFLMAEANDPDTGEALGSEYDVWVFRFGREAFGLEEHDVDGDGVVDQVTKNGQPVSMGDVSPNDSIAGLQGVSLYTGSEDSASLWANYDFLEGRLRGLNSSFGLIYTGPAETSIPIGGIAVGENSFGTPATEERYRIDLGLGYRWKFSEADLKLQLNVYNMLDDRKGQSIVYYRNGEEGVQRRTDVYYSRRSLRLTLSARF